MIVRPIEQRDWPTIDWLASNEVQEGDHSRHGHQWGQLRRTYPGERVDSVLASGDDVVAYVALERNGEDDDWRAFIVLDWSLRESRLQETAYEALEALVDEQEASTIWMRELAGDLALIAFVESKGFVVERRYTHDGLDIVNLRKSYRA